MKTLFIPAHAEVDVLAPARKALHQLKGFKKIGLLATVQHLQVLPELAGFLAKNGKKAVIGGQILGCNFEHAKKIESQVDCFLLVCSGKFHGLGLAQEVNKQVLILDPSSEQLTEILKEEVDQLERKKLARIEKAKIAQVYGILVSTKKGQESFGRAIQLQKRLRVEGKEAYIFLGDLFQRAEVLNFPQIKCWINTACPRIVEDDWEKLLINARDLPDEKIKTN